MASQTPHSTSKTGVCPICLEDTHPEQESTATKTRTLACNHAFHTDCIKQWLVRNPTCPCCRAEVIANDAMLEVPPENDDQEAVVIVENHGPDNPPDQPPHAIPLVDRVAAVALRAINRLAHLFRDVFGERNEEVDQLNFVDATQGNNLDKSKL